MQQNSKKKNILISVLSVVLAATLLFGGGTYAYLQGTTDDVVNNFDPNKVLVDLEETTGGDYDIIPGTSQDKDPTVKVNTTIPAYVYVTVTDETEGLVDYEIADGWTQLTDANGNPVENVYYREVEGSDAEQAFPVLKDNKVYYDKALENSDMLDEDGNLKEGVKLTFSASAIQKEPFNDAYLAYAQEEHLIMNEDELVAAIKAKAPIKIGQDFTVSKNNLGVVVPDEDLVDIDLNGYTLTFTQAFYAGVTYSDGDTQAENIRIANGGLNIQTGNNTFSAIAANSSLTLENVTVNSASPYNFFPSGDGAVLTINNCYITETAGGLIIGTNATSDYNCTINVNNSTLESGFTDGWTGSAIALNVPGTLNIDNSTIIGEKQAVLVRCGTANISNSTLSRPYALDQATEDRYLNGIWGQANNVPFASLVIGNRSNTNVYKNSATVTLDNVKLTAYNEDGVAGKTVYLYGNTADRLATLNYNAANCEVGDIIQGNENTVVNAY